MRVFHTMLLRRVLSLVGMPNGLWFGGRGIGDRPWKTVESTDRGKELKGESWCCWCC